MAQINDQIELFEKKYGYIQDSLMSLENYVGQCLFEDERPDDDKLSVLIVYTELATTSVLKTYLTLPEDQQIRILEEYKKRINQEIIDTE